MRNYGGAVATTARSEFGDYQTPREFAAQVCKFLRRRNTTPASVIEPTCGVGNFLIAALASFPTITQALGVDINADHVAAARSSIDEISTPARIELVTASFFDFPWRQAIAAMPAPSLIIGNPPWVTNARLGLLGSNNIPGKTNFRGIRGLDALTGKSNFDISEWMLMRLVEALHGSHATLAMLCKNSVARKILTFAWNRRLNIALAEAIHIDAAHHFGAAVEACLLYLRFGAKPSFPVANFLPDLTTSHAMVQWGMTDGIFLADTRSYEKWRDLWTGKSPIWRSGIKHDCAAIMEVVPIGEHHYRNGRDEIVELDDSSVFPLLKGSQIARNNCTSTNRFMIVPQRTVGENTDHLRKTAPRTWNYLHGNAPHLARRASSIYKGKPPFSIFGIGEYSFAPWKIAISGLHKSLDFRVVGNLAGKPFVLDDTCYFVPCPDEYHAQAIAQLLNSPQAKEALGSFIFWDSKRPITVEVLRHLDVAALARVLHAEKRVLEAACYIQRACIKNAGHWNTPVSLFLPSGQ